jgi:hypothetical protein
MGADDQGETEGFGVKFYEVPIIENEKIFFNYYLEYDDLS